MNTVSTTSTHELKGTIAQGLTAAWPICLGYVPIGLAFGVLAQKAGMNSLEIALMSVLVFALKTRSLGGTVVAGMLLFWLTGKVM